MAEERKQFLKAIEQKNREIEKKTMEIAALQEALYGSRKGTYAPFSPVMTSARTSYLVAKSSHPVPEFKISQ